MAAVNVATKTGVVTMKVAQISKSKAGFDIVEREIPQPGAGHVRIKVQACGVCHSDVLTGFELSGEVARVYPERLAGRVDAPSLGTRTPPASGERPGEGGATMLDLDQAIRERHSTRMFLPTPVPRDLVEEALALAQCAPSNSNIQPWHMVFASGEARDRLVAALLDEAKRRPPNVPPLPEAFQHYRSELGREVYGSMGIAREDKEGHLTAVLRNWEFFRAPLAGIVCMHRDLGLPDAVSVGMYLQTLLLALSERGLGTCCEVSVVGYPEIVRAQLAIPEELSLLCGLAVGYPDPEFPANKLHIRREAISENVVFLGS